jgi:shikimate kinase
MIIYLIGFMGVGKSTIGKALARKTGMKFIDTDRAIEKKYGLFIPHIFEFEGEEAFREKEHASLLELTKLNNIIISAGGGTPCFYDNLLLMKQTGLVIYLKASVGFLLARLQKSKSKRPIIHEKSDIELLEYIKSELHAREKYYSQAHLIIPAKNADLDMICSEISSYSGKLFK